MYFSSNRLRFAVDDDVTKTQCQYNNANLIMWKDDWNHIVGVRDRADDSLYIYINGEKVASLFDGTVLDISNLSPMIIGNGETMGRKLGDAILDEIRLYDVALSPAEIAALTAEYGVKSKPANVVAWWKLDGDATDYLGTSDGTLMNGDASVWVAGHTDQAYDFSEVTDSTHILVPHNDVIDMDSTQSFSVSLLITGDTLTDGIFIVKVS